MLSEEALFGEERRGRCVTVGITESKRKTIIESEGESGEETSDYEIFQVARSTQNIRVMFNVLFSSEEVQAEGLADVEPPEEWMQRPKTVGHLAIDQLLIWLLKSHTHKKTDPLRKYYCNLSVIVQLALEHDIIPELIRMITNGQDNALYLLFHLSRVNIYCNEIMRSQEENLLDCLDMTFLQNKKPQMNILAICSMIQVVCNSNALANWLLKEYDLKLKITETFNLNHSQSYMELQWKTILVTTVAASLNYIGNTYYVELALAGDILEYVWNEHLDIDSIISQELGTRLEENQIINEYNSCDGIYIYIKYYR